MSKILVAYFSASGITKKVANVLSEATGGDIFEIKPTVPYTKEDLDWRDSNSRSSVEMSDKNSRPKIAEKVECMEQYDTVFVGFPIWWYIAPTIINTFFESYDFSGKNIIVFATSGGSGFGKTLEGLKESCPEAQIIEGKLMGANVTKAELKAWVDMVL